MRNELLASKQQNEKDILLSSLRNEEKSGERREKRNESSLLSGQKRDHSHQIHNEMPGRRRREKKSMGEKRHKIFPLMIHSEGDDLSSHNGSVCSFLLLC